MKADTFAKLVVLDALIEAEVGFFLSQRSRTLETFREGMVARISDLIDDIDVLDEIAAGRSYDAVVDFLAELPDDDDGVVEEAIRFRRAVERIVARGMDRRDLSASASWAIVLGELLTELADEYHAAIDVSGEVKLREYSRVEVLLSRARQAAERMLWTSGSVRPDIADEMDRLTYGIRHRKLKPTAVDGLVRAVQRRAAKYRPSTISRVGGFVLRQLVRGEGTRPKAGVRPSGANSKPRTG